jgi:uroporphyrinogen decarboxylase
MNSRDRFRESLLFGQPDKVTLTSHFGPKPSLIEKWHGEGLPENEPYDQIHGLERCDRLPITFGPFPRYEDEVIKEFGGHKLIRNWLGQIVEYESDLTGPSADYPTRSWHEFPVKTGDDFEKMKWRYDPSTPELYPPNWAQIVESYTNRDFPVSITMPSMFWRVRDWTGLKNLSIMFHRDPDLVHEMMDFWTDYVIGLTERALHDMEVDYVLMSDDMAYKGRSMISPEMMRGFMLPNYRRWVDHFKGHGVDIILMDCDGHVHDIAPVWVQAGINILCPMEVNAGNDILRLREELGHDMAFLGGIDKLKVAVGGRALEREFESKVPQLIEDGGYIPCCDHYIPPNVSYPNYCHFISLLKRYCGWEA